MRFDEKVQVASPAWHRHHFRRNHLPKLKMLSKMRMLNTLWVIMMAMKIVIMMVMVMRRTMKTFGGKRRIISNANEEDKFVRDDDIHIMMHVCLSVCLSVTKNEHFFLLVSCNHLNHP